MKLKEAVTQLRQNDDLKDTILHIIEDVGENGTVSLTIPQAYLVIDIIQNHNYLLENREVRV